MGRGWSMMTQPLVYPPLVVVMRDGSRIIAEVEEPNEALPRPRMGTPRHRVINRAVAEIQVLSEVSLEGWQFLSDQGTTVVQLTDDDPQESVRLEAYGLRRAKNEIGGARRLLGLMIESLLKGPPNDEYLPSWLRITTADDMKSWGMPSVSAGQTPLDWPGPPLLQFFPARDRAGERSLGVGGSIVQEVLSALGNRHTLSTWTDGTTTMDLFITILYPGEVDFVPPTMIKSWAGFDK
jgi:hypothetical protein